MTLQPCANPTSDDPDTAHFYQADSTNTLVIKRLGNCVLAAAHGRNEVNNTSEVPLLDRTRNKMVTLGAKLGLGAVQWQTLTDAFVQR